MNDRINIKTDEEIRERLRESKRQGETWDGLLLRAADCLEGDNECPDEDAVREIVREEVRAVIRDELQTR